MKKKWLQRGLCAGMAAVLTLSFAGCGKQEKKKGVGQDPSLAKQYVYAYKELEGISSLGEQSNIVDVRAKDGKLFVMAQKFEGDASSKYLLLTMKEDGTDTQTVELEMPAEDAKKDSGAGSDVKPLPLPRSAVVNGVASATMEAAPGVAVPGGEDGAAPSRYENTYYNYFRLSGSADQIYAIREHTVEDYSSENSSYQQDSSLCSWDISGKLLWRKDVKENLPDKEADVWYRDITAKKDGTLFLQMEGYSGEKSYALHVTVDKDGNFVKVKEMPREEGKEVIQYIEKKDGSFYALHRDANYTSMMVAPWDPETGKVGEGQKMPERMSVMGFNTMVPGVDTDLAFTNNQGVFTYNVGDADITQIMSFVNSNLYTFGFNYLVMLDAEHFVASYTEPDSGSSKVGYFTKVKPEDIPDKEVMVLAGTYLNYDVKKRVIEFNKSSDKYRIVLKEYEMYNTNEDYMAGATKLNSDIIAGNMPDILVCSGEIPVENYVSKGLLADIGKRIAQDEQLSKESFLDNIFNAYKINDKLYYVIPQAGVRTLIGKKSILGDRTSWTMAEFQEVLKSLPEGTKGFGDMTRESFLSSMMFYCGNDFVDLATGKCNFDSQNFKDLLVYAKEMPEQLDESVWQKENYWMEYESQWRDNKTLLMEMYLSDMRGTRQNIFGYFGEEVTMVGFPTDSGKGSVVTIGTYYAMSAKSANQDGAWEFLRYYLTQEYQDTQWQIPTNRASYQAWLDKGMEKNYYLDENGNKVEQEDTFYLNGEEIPLPVMTREQVDQIGAFIESVDKPSNYKEQVYNIVAEETAAYFAGQKSVDEVANVIQSRVQPYVNENR